MTDGEARRVLREYRAARETIHEAVVVLHAHGVTQVEIAAVAGLSREGVRRILARHEATAVTAVSVIPARSASNRTAAAP